MQASSVFSVLQMFCCGCDSAWGVTLSSEGLKNLGLCRCVELQVAGFCRLGLQEQEILPELVLSRGQ